MLGRRRPPRGRRRPGRRRRGGPRDDRVGLGAGGERAAGVADAAGVGGGDRVDDRLRGRVLRPRRPARPTRRDSAGQKRHRPGRRRSHCLDDERVRRPRQGRPASAWRNACAWPAAGSRGRLGGGTASNRHAEKAFYTVRGGGYALTRVTALSTTCSPPTRCSPPRSRTPASPVPPPAAWRSSPAWTHASTRWGAGAAAGRRQDPAQRRGPGHRGRAADPGAGGVLLLGVEKRVLVLPHTDCGMTKVTDDDVHRITAGRGVAPAASTSTRSPPRRTRSATTWSDPQQPVPAAGHAGRRRPVRRAHGQAPPHPSVTRWAMLVLLYGRGRSALGVRRAGDDLARAVVAQAGGAQDGPGRRGGEAEFGRRRRAFAQLGGLGPARRTAGPAGRGRRPLCADSSSRSGRVRPGAARGRVRRPHALTWRPVPRPSWCGVGGAVCARARRARGLGGLGAGQRPPTFGLAVSARAWAAAAVMRPAFSAARRACSAAVVGAAGPGEAGPVRRPRSRGGRGPGRHGPVRWPGRRGRRVRRRPGRGPARRAGRGGWPGRRPAGRGVRWRDLLQGGQGLLAGGLGVGDGHVAFGDRLLGGAAHLGGLAPGGLGGLAASRTCRHGRFAFGQAAATRAAASACTALILASTPAGLSSWVSAAASGAMAEGRAILHALDTVPRRGLSAPSRPGWRGELAFSFGGGLQPPSGQ